MMRGLGLDVSPVGVASCYRDFLDVMVIDKQDAQYSEQIEDLGIPTVITDTIMRDQETKAALAGRVLQAAGLQR